MSCPVGSEGAKPLPDIYNLRYTPTGRVSSSIKNRLLACVIVD
jgi:hypothetical protein